MVDKTSKNGRSYGIDGRVVIWHPEDDEGEQGNLPDIRLPLRIKMKVIMSMADRDLDNLGMREMLTAILPAVHHDVLDEMDVNDFQDMFATWQSEYNSLTGGSLGEPSPSSASTPSTPEPSSTTSVVSV